MDLSRYRKGSYNSIEFYTPASSIRWGQKTVVHKYPKSDRTEVEFLGLNQREFNVQLIVHGNNYFEKRKALTEELNRGSYGLFIHPIDGEIKVAVLGYALDEKEAELGRATFNVTFQEVSDQDEPDQAETFIGKIQARATDVLSKTLDFIKDRYVTNFADSYESAGNQIIALGDEVAFQVSKIIGEDSAINKITGIIDEINSDPFKSVSTAENVSESIDVMLSNLSFIGTAEENFTANQGLFTSGDDIATEELTVVQQEVKQNTDLINSVVQLQALVYAYKSTLNIAFRTLEELKVKQDALEAQYAKIYTGLDGDLKENLDLLRASCNSYYLSLNLYDIIEIETNGESLDVICYKYYGSRQFYDEIKTLNDITNPSYVSGTIKIYNNDTF